MRQVDVKAGQRGILGQHGRGAEAAGERGGDGVEQRPERAGQQRVAGMARAGVAIEPGAARAAVEIGGQPQRVERHERVALPPVRAHPHHLADPAGTGGGVEHVVQMDRRVQRADGRGAGHAVHGRGSFGFGPARGREPAVSDDYRRGAAAALVEQFLQHRDRAFDARHRVDDLLPARCEPAQLFLVARQILLEDADPLGHRRQVGLALLEPPQHLERALDAQQPALQFVLLLLVLVQRAFALAQVVFELPEAFEDHGFVHVDSDRGK